jgi:two-component system sensor histidine kinase PilS (NtrC family)
VRDNTFAADPRLRALLDPNRILRWVYIGRISIAFAIFLAAVASWREAEKANTLVASLMVTASLAFTGASAIVSEIYRRPLTRTFLYAQVLFDLLLVTSVVHTTGGGVSQFAALYIVVIAVAALLLPTSGNLLVSAFGCVLYFGDVILTSPSLEIGIWLQLGVFATVALGGGHIAGRLRDAGAGTEVLAAELVKVRLQADDILRNIRSGIVTIDRTGHLLYANPAATALLGMPLDQLIGQQILPRVAGASPELARALDRTAREGIRTPRAEGVVKTRDRSFPVGMHTTISEGDGAVTESTATAIFQDISDQKRLDTLHLRAQRLEAVAELSASLAHEIKNPLASIRSAVEQLARSKRADADEKSLAGLIVRESDRLARLLTEFLDFARVRVAKVERIDMRRVAQGAANLATAHPDRENGIQVECVLPREPMVIEGDEDLLHRAVFNLALNAVQASPAQGRVRVELAPLSVDQVETGVMFDHGGVALRVSDEGPGIPDDIRDLVFDPFFTTKPGGTGLGLSVVHRAIEAHRGFVFCDSDGRGTRFTVLLPARQSENGELS